MVESRTILVERPVPLSGGAARTRMPVRLPMQYSTSSPRIRVFISRKLQSRSQNGQATFRVPDRQLDVRDSVDAYGLASAAHSPPVASDSAPSS